MKYTFLVGWADLPARTGETPVPQENINCVGINRETATTSSPFPFPLSPIFKRKPLGYHSQESQGTKKPGIFTYFNIAKDDSNRSGICINLYVVIRRELNKNID